ncbi:RNA-binding component of cleavage and polyadenylation factor [Epichloe bromicola]|uniref:RNA-binding component of cleavage and polyadenylation factor n=1 Tax=Epichloe bromicola TaxID=79588 RepID=A0ABQ0CK63_9HYPO
MALTTNLMDFVRRFQDIQHQRDSSDQLVRDVLLYCDRLETALRHVKQNIPDELQDCKREMRELQAQLSNSEARIEWYTNEIDEIRNQNAYILVAIDGDSLLFRDHWIKQSVEGGKKAALALRDAIKVKCGEHADDVEIIAKVVANLGGVAKALGRDLSDIRDFALGFTQAKAAFDFIDVGYGKDCASSKTRDTIKWHINNHNCRHVLMGVPRDASYASFLDEVAQDDFNRQRLTIIEGVPAAPGFAAWDFSTINLGKDLFRADKQNDKNAPVWPLGAWAGGPRTASPAASIASASTPGRSSLSYANAASTAQSSPPPPPPQMTVPIPPKPMARPAKAQYQQVPPQQPDWDPGFRGLDEPITVNISAMDSIKKRKESDKLCNNHFLRGPCAKGDSCFFVHDYKPSNEEINAIAVLARQNPCTNGQDCDSDDCIYGHHCPSIREGVCTHPFCKFAEDAHPPGTKYKNPNIKVN